MYSHKFETKNDGRYMWEGTPCTCCPYGYHIDLDFVQYCESINQESDRTGSMKRRKDRRRQRQSMEVLLGIVPSIELELTYKPIQENETTKNNTQPPVNQDSFDNAITDFERTLQRSKNKLSNNLPDVTAVSETITRMPSNSSICSTSSSDMTVLAEAKPRDFDSVSIESNGLSPTALQHIREQMAMSLERTRNLEEQVKLIPELKAQVASLREENHKLKAKDRLTNLKSQSSTSIDSLPRKDCGVNCGVLTRNVGVGHQTPHTKTVSTATVACMGDTRETQTPRLECKEAVSQTLYYNKESSTQTIDKKKSHSSIAVTASPRNSDFGVQKVVEVYNVGVSDDTISESNCEKCNVAKCTVGVGPSSNEDAHTGPVSLGNLMGPRSKSFNLQGEKLNLTSRKRSTASQYDLVGINKACQYEPNSISKGCQSERKTISKASQSEVKTIHKDTQYEYKTSSKDTDTLDLLATIKHVGCQVIETKKTNDVAVNTETEIKKETTQSKIPRLQIPTTPVEVRKFRRQDTYTKVYSSPDKSPPLSGLDLSPKLPLSEPGPLDKVKQSFKLPEVISSCTQNDETTIAKLPVSEPSLFQPSASQTLRKKAVPSREMLAAMKVLNDSLQKCQTNPNRNVENQNAIKIIQQEWFKVSSLVTANPLDVEDYLDKLEDVSSILLQYVVNMADESGNTAMHYAVSHGNLDVVSILLDSKVCDINKPNKAGYTSVMLVSLADVNSQTHANVVKRLFQLADVNLRALQHGQTALMLAVSHGKLDMVKILLEAGADINIQDEDGSTALMCASEHGHIDIIKFLLSQPECDSSITDIDGSTALKIAMEAGHRHIGVLLYAHQRNIQGLHNKKKSKPSSPKTPSITVYKK